jgi:outer membrane protein TolC
MSKAKAALKNVLSAAFFSVVPLATAMFLMGASAPAEPVKLTPAQIVKNLLDKRSDSVELRAGKLKQEISAASRTAKKMESKAAEKVKSEGKQPEAATVSRQAEKAKLTPAQIVKNLLAKKSDSLQLRSGKLKRELGAERAAKAALAKEVENDIIEIEIPEDLASSFDGPAAHEESRKDLEVKALASAHSAPEVSPAAPPQTAVPQILPAANATAEAALTLQRQPETGENQKSLLNCIDIALTGNPQILESLHNLEAQKYKIGQAKAPLKPQTSAGAKTGWQDSDSSSRAGESSSRYANRSASVSYSQVVYDGGKISSGISAAVKSLEVYELNHKKLLMDTFLKICENYYSLITTMRLEKVARQTHDGAMLHQTLAEANFNVGISPKTDFIRAQANTFEKKYSHIAAQNSLKKSRLALNYTMGREGYDIQVIDSLVCDTLGVDLEKSIARALEARSEIAAAKKNIEIYRLQIDQIKAEKKPQLSIGANAGVDFDNSANKSERSSYSATASFSFPLTNGYLTENKVGEIEEKIRAAERSLEQLILTIKYDVTQAYLNLLETYEQIGVASKNAEYADLTLKLTDEQYKVGLATMIDLIDAELAYSRAMTNHIQSQGSFLIAKCKFRRNIGDEEFYR